MVEIKTEQLKIIPMKEKIVTLIDFINDVDVGSGINNNKIFDLNVEKLTAGTITSKTITLEVSAGLGDAVIKAGKTDFGDDTAGFILGIDDSDSDLAKFEIGNASDYFKWDGYNVTMLCSAENAIHIQYGSDILLEHGGDIKFTSVTAPIACVGALAGAGAGNVDDGTHKYKITYINDTGETELGAVSNTVTVADKSTNGKISLTSIPISTSGSVIARKIYRTKAGDTDYYLLTTINDNTTTTYTDNTADASLGGVIANNRENSSFGKIFIDNVVSLSLGENSFVGFGSGASNTTGINNTVVGYLALENNTTGGINTAVGNFALQDNTIGSNNTAIGGFSLDSNISGNFNIALGYFSLKNSTSGDFNISIGYHSLNSTNGDDNVAVGSYALDSNVSGDNNVAIGHQAGFYETGSKKLFIDNTLRANEADGRVKALVYGVFAAAIASQLFRINGILELTSINSGATQAAAGATANEVWKTSSHATLPDNVLMIGV